MQAVEAIVEELKKISKKVSNRKEKKITSLKDLLPLLEKVAKAGRPLLVIA
jgi:hypothetical protein